MIKKPILIISIIAAVVCVGVGILIIKQVGFLTGAKSKPQKNYVTEYIAEYSPYAVMVLYDDQKRLEDIAVARAKSGVRVGNFVPSDNVVRYEISEASSTIIFTLYNTAGEKVEVYEFDTEKGEGFNKTY